MPSQVEKEKARWEKKHKPKPVLAERIKAKKIKEADKHSEKFNSGDY